ncbi:MAG: ABC-F family ATP-binding cassette domain-containing protein [Bacteroidales bacterium]|nr:ABC-F family ATP-binding cassette domain-containing protein [Bacteroidales bacterium]
MNYLSVEGISKSYGIKTLFSDVTFGIEKGDKTALIASNGSGKSTMLKIIVGKESMDTGTVTFANDIRVGYLEQLPQYDPDLTIQEVVAAGHVELMRVVGRYEKALREHTDETNKVTKAALELAIAEMDAMEAWSYEQRLIQLLTRFELTDLQQRIGNLSGGQVKRLALALVLLDNPDLLILDEPTNHLDVEMVEWLEKYLSQSNVTLLMVTHDRYFLDRVCNKIFELYQSVMYTHYGNFDYYVEKSREREEVKRATAQKASAQLRHELEWIRATPQARTGKSKSRIDAFYELKDKAKYQEPEESLQFGLQAQRLGGKILEMYNVTKRYDDVTVLKDFDYVFQRGERIGLIGKNGVGKSSFLNLITRQVAPDRGKIIVGDTVTFGYYRQGGITFDEDKTVIDAIRDIAEVINYGKDQVYTADQLLAHFMFPHKMHRQPISLLSGGEKRRLYLLTVLVSNPNFLILDEPTNDLDLLTLQKLEDFLKAYKGCLLVVSHDRFFMDQVVDQLFVFQGDGKVKGFMGNYSQYKDYLQEKEAQQRLVQQTQKSVAKEEEPKRLREKKKRSFKEDREYAQLTEEIAALEAEKQQISQEMNSVTDYQLLQQLGNRLQEINALLDEKELRWLELDEWS